MLALVDHLETAWDQPDDGNMEDAAAPDAVRRSEVVAWVAFDLAIKLQRASPCAAVGPSQALDEHLQGARFMPTSVTNSFRCRPRSSRSIQLQAAGRRSP